MSFARAVAVARARSKRAPGLHEIRHCGERVRRSHDSDIGLTARGVWRARSEWSERKESPCPREHAWPHREKPRLLRSRQKPALHARDAPGAEGARRREQGLAAAARR